MSDLRSRIASESQIGKLKLLVVELNQTLPEDKRIVGYSAYTLAKIEDLRRLALSKLGDVGGDVDSDKLEEIRNIGSIAGLKKMASLLGLSGYSGYKADQKEKLRAEIIAAVQGKRPAPKKEPVIVPPVAPVKKVDITAMTVKELRALADERGIYIRSKALKDEIIIALSKAVVTGPPVAPPKKEEPIIAPPVAPPKKEPSIDVMTVKELKALAAEREIYIPSKALKDEIIRLLKAGKAPAKPIMKPPVKPPKVPETVEEDDLLGLPPLDDLSLAELRTLGKEMGFKIPPKISKAGILEIIKGNVGPRKSSDTCISAKTVDRLTTIPIYDYDHLNLVNFSGASINSCLTDMGVGKAKAGVKGSYGVTYADNFNGSPAIFKVVKFPNPMGVEGFKWECVISRRAAALGVGPEVLETSMCYSGKTPKFGVMVLGRCGPLASDYAFTKAELAEIYQLIVKLNNNGIAHRDLGKRNIMRSGGRLVLIDYGLALAFPGPVPEEYKIWDHTYLSYDTESYYEYLKTIFPASSIKKIDQLEDDVKLESLTIQYFPVDMLRTLGYERTLMYINNADTTAKAVITDRMLKKRFADEGL